MSYRTRVEVEWHDSESKGAVNVDRIVERAKIYVREQGISDDVLDDLRSALQGIHNDGLGFNRMYSDMIEDMLLSISRGFPEIVFFARGAGEEFHDMWLRVFRNGEISDSHGPWNV